MENRIQEEETPLKTIKCDSALFLKCDSHWFTTEHINFEMCTMKLLRVYAIPDNILRFIYYGPISLMCMLRHYDKDKDIR